MLLSLVYRLLRHLFGLLLVLVRSDLSKDVELLVLCHENQVLRRRLGGRLRWDHADRLWLTTLSRVVNRLRWAEIFPVTPATILRWHRDVVARKWTYTDRRGPGRPSTGVSIKALIVRMAREFLDYLGAAFYARHGAAHYALVENATNAADGDGRYHWNSEAESPTVQSGYARGVTAVFLQLIDCTTAFVAKTLGWDPEPYRLPADWFQAEAESERYAGVHFWGGATLHRTDV